MWLLEWCGRAEDNDRGKEERKFLGGGEAVLFMTIGASYTEYLSHAIARGRVRCEGGRR